MIIGIGGAGNKIASMMDKNCTLINISNSELNKYPSKDKLLAVVHSAKGQRHGAKKIPSIGMDAFISIKEQVMELMKSNIIIASTGGGTGNGISRKILEYICAQETVAEEDKTCFIFVLPDGNKEPFEFVQNTIDFLSGPLSAAIDSGNTGNIFLISNKKKFDARATEHEYNEWVCAAFNQFLTIPDKCDNLEQIEGYIDKEDFMAYLSKPYFNYFTSLPYKADDQLEKHLDHHRNMLLLKPDAPIEALFLLEIPKDGDAKSFYNILEYFDKFNIVPIYAVVQNPAISKPLLTVSYLYSRKPQGLVDDFTRLLHARSKEKIKKSLEQHVVVTRKTFDIKEEAKKTAHDIGKGEEDIIAVLKRIGKL